MPEDKQQVSTAIRCPFCDYAEPAEMIITRSAPGESPTGGSTLDVTGDVRDRRGIEERFRQHYVDAGHPTG